MTSLRYVNRAARRSEDVRIRIKVAVQWHIQPRPRLPTQSLLAPTPRRPQTGSTSYHNYCHMSGTAGESGLDYCSILVALADPAHPILHMIISHPVFATSPAD